MEVDLAGRVIVLAGRAALREPLRTALARSGATVEDVEVADAALVAAAAGRNGRLDGLVVLAAEGVPDPGAVEAACRAGAAAMKEGGRIVTVASALGMVAARGEVAASAAAAAMFSLTRALALELGGKGIRANALAIGPATGTAGERFLSHTPLGRPGTVKEIVAPLLFLLDPANSYMNGHVLVADGGWSAGFARDF